jgi:hypothetical protein
MKEGIFARVSKIDTTLSFAEWCWRGFTIVSVGGTAVVTGFLAKADPILRELGPIYWVGLSLIFGIVVAIIFLIIKASVLKQASASYYRSLSAPKSIVNPLLESFENIVIPIEDLRLPGKMVHENKHFRNCKFVGPGALGIGGGNFSNIILNECGDVICVQDEAYVTGIIMLYGCTMEKCELIRVTILADINTCQGFKNMGVNVSGLVEIAPNIP